MCCVDLAVQTTIVLRKSDLARLSSVGKAPDNKPRVRCASPTGRGKNSP